ncbi:MAG: hypothetical protein ACRCYU_03655, partial [Nocardioides sp.]
MRTCFESGSAVAGLNASSASDGYRYRVRLYCLSRLPGQDSACAGGSTDCSPPAGGVLYDLLRADAAPGSSWTQVGQACLGQGDLLGLGEITPELVLTEFRKLTWPKPDLIIQPPGGETLVNLATNFYTTLTTPKTQTVTLLGQRITIEATPAEYQFVFGEDGEYLDTKNPGGAYPRLDNTYEYRDAHVTRYPYVWVTYT